MLLQPATTSTLKIRRLASPRLTLSTMPRRLPGAAAIVAASAAAAAAAPSALAFVNVRRAAPPFASVAYASNGGGDDEGSASAAGITFFLSPSSLTHLSYLDGPDVPPPVYASALVSDDDDDDDDVNDDVASSSAAAASTATGPTTSLTISAKLPALAVGLLGAIVVGYGGTHFLEDVFHLDLLTAGPLLYFLGFSTGWQAMGGDEDLISQVEMEPQISAPDGNVDDDRDASSIQYVLDAQWRPTTLSRRTRTSRESQSSTLMLTTAMASRRACKTARLYVIAASTSFLGERRLRCESRGLIIHVVLARETLGRE